MPTIGVALSIPEPWGQQLQDYRASIGDETATQIPTHVTLVPPMAIEDDTLRVVEEHLEVAASEVEAFRIRLRGTGTFRPVSPVVFVTLAEGISHCEALADAVRRGPLAVELVFPYHPHVTIAHHLDDEVMDTAFDELSGFDCVFDVDRFALYVHDSELGWQATREFPLG